jgi:hypothetical protein
MRNRRSLEILLELKSGKELRLTKINDELDNLKTGNPFLPPDFDASRALEVVPVHDDVNHKVERDWNP